jgi:hypothetical protein
MKKTQLEIFAESFTPFVKQNKTNNSVPLFNKELINSYDLLTAQTGNVVVKKIGHRKRAKDKFLNNVSHGKKICDRQLLELLLFLVIPRRNVMPIVDSLLEKFGTIHNIAQQNSYDNIQSLNQLQYIFKLFRTLNGRI